jgi:endoglucanase
MTVGFNALSGEDLSGDTSLTSELLMASGSELMLL